MSAPIHTRHRSSHFFESVRGGGPPVSTAFSYTNGASASGRRRKHAPACGRRMFSSVCLGNAVETGGPPPRTDSKKCEDRCRVLIGALIYMYVYIYICIIYMYVYIYTYLYLLTDSLTGLLTYLPTDLLALTDLCVPRPAGRDTHKSVRASKSVGK